MLVILSIVDLESFANSNPCSSNASKQIIPAPPEGVIIPVLFLLGSFFSLDKRY